MNCRSRLASRRVYLVAEARMPTAGFVAGCCFPRKEIVGMSVNALTFAVYLQRSYPGFPSVRSPPQR
jgi:hypothetical protein